METGPADKERPGLRDADAVRPAEAVCGAHPPVIKEIDVEETAAVLDGVTRIVIEGSEDNIVTAFWFDPALCYFPSMPAPTFHWVINTPNAQGYTARGISGYQNDTLEIAANSIPDFIPATITFQFTVTSSVPNPSGNFLSTTKSFRALYRNSALTIGMSTTCQTMQETGNGCDIEAALAVVPGTQT